MKRSWVIAALSLAGAAHAQQQTPIPRTAAEQRVGITPVNYMYSVGDVRRYIASFNGSADDTAVVQEWLNLGGKLTAPLTGIITVTSPLTISSGTTLIAYSGFVIKQADSANITGPILLVSSARNVVIDGLTLDGNATHDITSWTYGIRLSNGGDNIIRNFYIHDTTEACIEVANESGDRITDNWLINCGQHEGTDNHGIMVVATTSTPVRDITISNNFINTAYRKGIAVYADAPGTAQGITVEGNTTINCGLGGIYIATAPWTAALKDIVVSHNISIANYTNIEISNVRGGEVVGNETEAGAAQSIYLSDDVGVNVTGNTVVNAGTDGIFATSSDRGSAGLTIAADTILYANQNSSPSGSGIHLHGVTNSTVVGNTVLGESGSPHQVYGILEDGSSDNNILTRNHIANVTSAPIYTVGATSAWDSQSGLEMAQNSSLSLPAILSSGVAASIAACGTPAVTGGATVGSFTAGDTSCNPVISTGITAPHGWHCSANDETTNITFRQTSYTTTSATLSATGPATINDVIDFSCIGF